MRTGAGTRCSLPPQLPQWQPPSVPRLRGPGETLREGAATFQRLRRRLANFSEFLLCASSGLRAGRAPRGGRSVRDGGLRLLPAGHRRPATPASLAASRAGTCAPTGTYPLCGRRGASSNAAVRVAQLETQRSGAGVGLGRGGALPGLGAGPGPKSLTFLGLTPDRGPSEEPSE